MNVSHQIPDDVDHVPGDSAVGQNWEDWHSDDGQNWGDGGYPDYPGSVSGSAVDDATAPGAGAAEAGAGADPPPSFGGLVVQVSQTPG